MYSSLPTPFFLMNNKTTVHVCDEIQVFLNQCDVKFSHLVILLIAYSTTDRSKYYYQSSIVGGMSAVDRNSMTC